MGQVSGVMCHKVLKLVGGGSVINRALTTKQKNMEKQP